MGNTRWTLQGLSGRKAGKLKEVGLGWIDGGQRRGQKHRPKVSDLGEISKIFNFHLIDLKFEEYLHV